MYLLFISRVKNNKQKNAIKKEIASKPLLPSMWILQETNTCHSSANHWRMSVVLLEWRPLRKPAEICAGEAGPQILHLYRQRSRGHPGVLRSPAWPVLQGLPLSAPTTSFALHSSQAWSLFALWSWTVSWWKWVFVAAEQEFSPQVLAASR